MHEGILSIYNDSYNETYFVVVIKKVDIMMRNLLHKRNVWALAILMVIAALGIAQAATTRPQTASLSGQVVTAVSVGASVQEGSVLVTDKTLAGSAPAARANCSGKVVSVSAKPGSTVSAGQVVAQIEEP